MLQSKVHYCNNIIMNISLFINHIFGLDSSDQPHSTLELIKQSTFQLSGIMYYTIMALD